MFPKIDKSFSAIILRHFQLHAGSRKSNAAKLSSRLHVSLVQSVKASKKGPHKQVSSVLGSHPASTAASFQQSVVHRPIPATSPPTSFRGSRGDDATGDASATVTDPSTTAANDIESFILLVCGINREMSVKDREVADLDIGNENRRRASSSANVPTNLMQNVL